MTAPAPIGATWLGADGTRFRVWAPGSTQVEVVLDPHIRGIRTTMVAVGDGWFELLHPSAPPGTRYSFYLDGRGPFPDPASRCQIRGVHGPSEVIDPAFRWTDSAWSGVPLDRLVLYELHIGSFTPEGTFRAAIERLPDLVALGVTAIELMPVGDFPGERNWGYDGVALNAPARAYGRPEDLRALVDAAHGLGLAVHLDVVYNHFGPDGAYQGAFASAYFSTTHRTPWGAALNFDGPDSGPVRALVIQSALTWVREYHLDGLRLDATHAIIDDSPVHILTEIAEAVHRLAAAEDRTVLVIAEDGRNLSALVRPVSAGGMGLDGVWSDDFHHQMRRALAGDRDGYFQDYSGSTADLAETIRQGWYYHGQQSGYAGAPRGSDPAGVPLSRFVCCLQNHDQIGNRALGERLHHQITAAAYRAASALLLCLPETPLLFMGQEWAASTPWLYFTDHHADLGEMVRRGRRQEFARFAAFSDPAARERIPDPQAPTTFTSSRLPWGERDQAPHRQVLALYQRLLELRRQHPALRGPGTGLAVAAFSDDVLLLRREAGPVALLAVVRLRGSGPVALRGHDLARHPAGAQWRLLLSTADAAYADAGVHHHRGPRRTDGRVWRTGCRALQP